MGGITANSDYWSGVRSIASQVYHDRRNLFPCPCDAESDKQAFSLDEQAGPAYFEGNLLSRMVFWHRLTTALQAIPDTPNRVCVDFGCGFGMALPLLSRRFEQVVGVDLVPQLSRTFLHAFLSAGRATHDMNLKSIRIRDDLFNAGLENGSVDLILALDVLEHIADLDDLLEKFDRLLSPNGALVVSGPTESWFYRLGRRVVGFSGEYHVSNIYRIEKELLKRFKVARVKRVPTFPALFEILVATGRV